MVNYAPLYQDGTKPPPESAVVAPVRWCQPQGVDKKDARLRELAQSVSNPELWKGLRLPNEPVTEIGEEADPLCALVFATVKKLRTHSDAYGMNAIDQKAIAAVLGAHPGKGALVLPFWYLTTGRERQGNTVRDAQGNIVGTVESAPGAVYETGYAQIGVFVFARDHAIWLSEGQCGKGDTVFCPREPSGALPVDQDFNHADAAVRGTLRGFPWKSPGRWALSSSRSRSKARAPTDAGVARPTVTRPSSSRSRSGASQISPSARAQARAKAMESQPSRRLGSGRWRGRAAPGPLHRRRSSRGRVAACRGSLAPRTSGEPRAGCLRPRRETQRQAHAVRRQKDHPSVARNAEQRRGSVVTRGGAAALGGSLAHASCSPIDPARRNERSHATTYSVLRLG